MKTTKSGSGVKSGSIGRRELLGLSGAVVTSVWMTRAGAQAATTPGEQAREAGPSHPLAVEAKPGPFTLTAQDTAVIVVDMQNDFGAPGGMFDLAGIDISGIRKAIAPTAAVISAARRTRIPIVYLKMAFQPDLSDLGAADSVNSVRHLQIMHVGKEVTAPNGQRSRILIRDTWNSDIIPELKPQPEDLLIYKSRFSGFYRTNLDEKLRAMGVKNLIVTGCTTSICVESTVRDAMFRDYRCLLLGDCMSEPIGGQLARTNHDASLLTVQTLLGWVSDSGRLLKALG
jgi:ureidoacrylate peracid hydrolase